MGDDGNVNNGADVDNDGSADNDAGNDADPDEAVQKRTMPATVSSPPMPAQTSMWASCRASRHCQSTAGGRCCNSGTALCNERHRAGRVGSKPMNVQQALPDCNVAMLKTASL